MHNKAVLFSKIKSSRLRLFFALLAHCSVLCGSRCSHFAFLQQCDVLFQLSFGIVYFLLFVSMLLLQLVKFGMKLKKTNLIKYFYAKIVNISFLLHWKLFGDLGMRKICCSHFLYIEWNLIRLGGPARGIMTKNVRKMLQGSHFCLSKAKPCEVISSQISSKFRGGGWVVDYLLCMPILAFWVSMLAIVKDCRSKWSEQ